MSRNMLMWIVCVCVLWRGRIGSANSCEPINIARPIISSGNIMYDGHCMPSDLKHVDIGGKSSHYIPALQTSHADVNFSTVVGNTVDRSQHDLSLLSLWPDGALLARSARHIQNPMCHRDVKFFLGQMQQLDLWALKMMDSSGRLPSGLLNGNVNQLGDFDQCLSVTSQDSKTPQVPEVKGKYCLASLDFHISSNARLDDLMHSHGAIVSNLSDPGHRIPRFSTVSWGFCIPSTCNAEDLEHVIATWAADRVKDIQVKVKVEREMCYTKDNQPSSTAKHIAIFFFCVILAMTAIGTLMKDEENNALTKNNENAAWKVLRSFSVRRNWATLVSPTTAKDDIKCLHGVRAMSALALVIFHKSSAIVFNPFVNRTAMAKSLGLAWSVIGRTASIHTDSFILLSGLLTACGLLKELDKKGRVDLKERYWARIFRIMPSLVALILFGTYIMVDLGSGPQWGLVVKHHSDLCKNNMWRNFMFIHNYFGLENMCFTHTHQLGIDMQLFLVSPFLVWLLWRYRTAGVLVFIAIGLASTILRFTVALHHQLSPVLYFGVSVEQMISTANLSYIIPSHRVTVYVLGLALGYFMKRVGTVKLNKVQVCAAWFVAFAMGLYAMCGPYEMARRDYQYSALDAAFWNAGAPILWSLFLAIGIVLCASDYGGKFAEFLSWRGFVIFTRLAYAVYLTQFPIFFYSVGSQRTAEFYTPFMLANLTEIATILIVSTVFTLLFDLPFQQMRKITWRSATEHAAETEKTLLHTNTIFNAKTERLASSNDVTFPKEPIIESKGARNASSG